MALIHTLLRLKDNGEIDNFQMQGETHATVVSTGGNTFSVYMSDEYIIGETQVRQGFTDNLTPEYIIYNEWDMVTAGAEDLARRLGAKIVKYGRFRYILRNLNGE